MAEENIDNTVSGSGLFNTKIPGLSDAADIQAALRLYHYGTYEYDGSNTNTELIPNPSVAHHFQKLTNDKANLSGANFTGPITTPNNTASRISFIMQPYHLSQQQVLHTEQLPMLMIQERCILLMLENGCH